MIDQSESSIPEICVIKSFLPRPVCTAVLWAFLNSCLSISFHPPMRIDRMWTGICPWVEASCMCSFSEGNWMMSWRKSFLLLIYIYWFLRYGPLINGWNNLFLPSALLPSAVNLHGQTCEELCSIPSHHPTAGRKNLIYSQFFVKELASCLKSLGKRHVLPYEKTQQMASKIGKLLLALNITSCNPPCASKQDCNITEIVLNNIFWDCVILLVDNQPQKLDFFYLYSI